MPNPVIGVTLLAKRVALRALSGPDLAALYATVGDFAAERYSRSIASHSPNILTSITAEDSAAAEWQCADRLALAVVEPPSDECIGLVGYHHFERADARVEIGYALAPPSRGRGLMTEAVNRFVQHCFEDLAVHRIDALIKPGNIASIRLAERIGFRHEGGPLREYARAGGTYDDLMIFGLLKRDLT
jgi:ribosomal-protein-alanine N-acetyltransferase